MIQIENSQQVENNKKIAKNTIVLYFRMFLTMVIGVFTSRIVLQALGIEDYGVYNVVGGITTMFVFINSSMSVASSRFIAFAIGKQDIEYEEKIFGHILYIHYAIGIIITLLIETIGLWFLYHKLSIPLERMNAAFWVLQFSAVTCFLNVICTPYNSLIVSHEKLSSFAYISILESCLKLGICYITLYSSTDKLILYAFLLMCISLLIRFIYVIYAHKNFNATHGKINIEKKIFYEIAAFAGWNTLGNIALVTIDQGVSILLNIFFGPIVNASRGVATQINNVIMGFSNNIRMAINPQITKSYSQGNIAYMHDLIRISSIYPFFMILVCFIPLWLIGDFLLHIWLVEVPKYALSFLRLSLIYTLVNSFANPIIIGIHATGQIKKFQLIEGLLMLLTLPTTYLFLKLGYSPESAYYAIIIIAIITQIGRLYIILPKLHMSYNFYLIQILLPCIKSTIAGGIILYITQIIYIDMPIIAFLLCIILSCIAVLYLGMNSLERDKIIKIAIQRLKIK